MGKMPQYTTWTDSWEEFFTNARRRLVSVIEGYEDLDSESRQLFETVLEKVVPHCFVRWRPEADTFGPA